MKNKIKAFIEHHKQLILYLLFGIITTVCSLGACYITLKLGALVWQDENGDPTAFVDILGSTTQWITGVLISFLTNKKWVFTQAEHGGKATLKQLGIFSSSRIATYFMEVGINLGVIALLEALNVPDVIVPFLFGLALTPRFWAKFVSSVFVVIANYFISKLVVFRKKPKSDSEIKTP